MTRPLGLLDTRGGLLLCEWLWRGPLFPAYAPYIGYQRLASRYSPLYEHGCYLVFDEQALLYVGQTQRPILHRIHDHVLRQSPLGDYILNAYEGWDEPWCRLPPKLVVVRHHRLSLKELESLLIDAWEPTLNIRRGQRA